MFLVNTQEFRREALHFLKHGYYTDAPEGTREWEQYWDIQRDRCLDGYSVGGIRITGNHYAYLNFCQILMVPEDGLDPLENPGGMAAAKAEKVQSFPAFWDGDYEFFHAVEIARHGISQEDYEALGLEVKIPYLGGGRHMVVLKARGKGFSYKTGMMLARNFQLKKRSKNYAIADETDYLTADGLLTKAYDCIDFMNEHTAWAQPLLVDKDLRRRSGYKQRTTKGFIPVGSRSEIIGITLKNNPSKARGKRGELILYEEAGKCPCLLEAWEINRPSVEQGSYATGMMLAFGTGGTKEADYASLEELFYHPEAYNCIPFMNIWDEGASGSKCSFFVPSYKNWEGYIDQEGNSDCEGAKAYIERERDKKKGAKDTNTLAQYVAENPFTPREATLQVTKNIFPILDLQMHLTSLESKEVHKKYPAGFLYEDESGRVAFRPDRSLTPLLRYPLRKEEDETGAVVVYEAPYVDPATLETPPGLYLVVHDPYAKDKSSSSVSLGAAYVLKMINNVSTSMAGLPVASYVGRPNTLDEYNDSLFKLARYYNAKIAFENNRGNVVEYAKRHRMLEYLVQEPASVKVKTGRKSVNGQSIVYGMTMSEPMKDLGEVYVRDYINRPLGRDSEGRMLKALHLILDPALIQELIKYNRGGNFDRVMALMVGQFFLKDVEAKANAGRDRKHSRLGEFIRRPIYR